jgi:hypothetical protein
MKRFSFSSQMSLKNIISTVYAAERKQEGLLLCLDYGNIMIHSPHSLVLFFKSRETTTKHLQTFCRSHTTYKFVFTSVKNPYGRLLFGTLRCLFCTSTLILILHFTSALDSDVMMTNCARFSRLFAPYFCILMAFSHFSLGIFTEFA